MEVDSIASAHNDGIGAEISRGMAVSARPAKAPSKTRGGRKSDKLPVSARDEYRRQMAMAAQRAAERLWDLIDNPDTKPELLLKAIETALDRGVGKPRQETDTGFGGTILLGFAGQIDDLAQ